MDGARTDSARAELATAAAVAGGDRARLNEADAAAWLAAARRGDLAQAWRHSDRILARTVAFGDPSVPRHVQQIWNGSPLAGRRVLVRCYHGLGDTIQFVRFLTPLRRVARHVVVWAQPALVPLLGHSYPDLDVVPLDDGAPAVDYEVDVEIMELAYVFRSTLETIPRRTPYLCAPRADAVTRRRPRVGLVWRGGGWDDRRSLPLALLSPLLANQAVAWFSLQPPPGTGERHPALTLTDLPTVLATASFMRQLDLVISIDTMAAHLAGALAVPVWTLLANPADWRWLEAGDRSPWYPTMELFRQPRPGAWEPVVEAVSKRLASFRVPASPASTP